MSEVRLFGESISSEVIQQIELREKIIAGTGTGSSSVLKTNTRSVKDIQQFSGRTAWIRMISSVDVFNNQGTPTPAQAKNFILSGGELQVSRNTVKRKSGVSFQAQDRNSVYRKSDKLGVRPEAGITSFDIKHKGTYGSLREANISFNIWTREDLDRAQNIYLRPGVHMIVEWGHTVYRDSPNGNNKQPLLPDSDKYFRVNTRDGIQKIIQDFRKENNLNYDGFIGLVSNFSWSFRPDGGYDCTVRIVSAGSLLESIGVETGHDNRYDELVKDSEKNTEKKEDKEESVNRSVFHALKALSLANKLKEGTSDKLSRGKQVINLFFNTGVTLIRKGINWNRRRQAEGTLKLIPESIDKVLLIQVLAENKQAPEGVFSYMRLDEVIQLLNTHIIKDEETASVAELMIVNPDQKYRTFPEHFSIDPSVCILPFDAKVSQEDRGENNITRIPSGLIDQKGKEDVKSLLRPIESSEFGREQGTSFIPEPGYIKDILINVEHIVSRLDSVLEESSSEISEKSMFDLVSGLLGDINTALGSINELSLYNQDGIWTVVDITFPNVTKNDIEEINITGLKNTVKDVSIETKITPNLANMIAVSAQGTKSVTGNGLTSNIGMVQWNSNIRDRFVKVSIEDDTSDDSIDERDKSEVERLRENISNLNKEIDELRKRNPSVGRDSAIISLTRDREKQEKELQRILNTSFNLRKVIEPFNDVYVTLFEGKQESRWHNLWLSTTERSFSSEVLGSYRRYAVKYFREKYFKSLPETEERGVQDTSDPGLIPVQLSITMDGIAGFVIGQVFKIENVEDVLPENYKNYGFILTAIDHSINAGRWETTIKALTFKLPK